MHRMINIIPYIIFRINSEFEWISRKEALNTFQVAFNPLSSSLSFNYKVSRLDTRYTKYRIIRSRNTFTLRAIIPFQLLKPRFDTILPIHWLNTRNVFHIAVYCVAIYSQIEISYVIYRGEKLIENLLRREFQKSKESFFTMAEDWGIL